MLKAAGEQPTSSQRTELLAAKNNACNLCGSRFKGDLEWEVSGQFTMLGVTKDQTITVRMVELDGRKFLVGKGEIDRTLYGMTPSATEGNIVSFDYQVELK